MNQKILEMVDNPQRRQEKKVNKNNEKVRDKALDYAKEV